MISTLDELIRLFDRVSAVRVAGPAASHVRAARLRLGLAVCELSAGTRAATRRPAKPLHEMNVREWKRRQKAQAA